MSQAMESEHPRNLRSHSPIPRRKDHDQQLLRQPPAPPKSAVSIWAIEPTRNNMTPAKLVAQYETAQSSAGRSPSRKHWYQDGNNLARQYDVVVVASMPRRRP